jgi:hypothetical protein
MLYKRRNKMPEYHGVSRENRWTKTIEYLSPIYSWVETKSNALKTDDETAQSLRRSFHAAEIRKKMDWEYSFFDFLFDEASHP